MNRADGQHAQRGFLVGMSIMAVACVSLVGGLLDPLDNLGLDLHQRYAGDIPADPRIVLIDINDHALGVIGDWPWPRRRYAQLVDTLNELGAKSIVLDLVFAEPSAPRTQHAGLGPNYDVDTSLTVHGSAVDDPPIYDDDELVAAMARGKNVYLAMFSPLTEPQLDSPVESATSKRTAQARAREFLAENPGGSFATFAAKSMPNQPTDANSPERNALLLAYRSEKAMLALRGQTPPTPASMRHAIPRATDLTLPVDKLAAAARGIGLVSFPRRESGGVVRDIPLIAKAGCTLLYQLGLLVGLDDLGIERSAITVEGDRLIIGTSDDRRTLAFDDRGHSLLYWHTPDTPEQWQKSFRHIPVARVLEVALNRESLDDNQRRLGLAWAELIALRHQDTPSEYAAYVKLINERRAAPAESVAAIDQAIAEVETEAVAWLRRAHMLWQSETPATELERNARHQIDRLQARFGDNEYPKRIAAIASESRTRTDALLDELRPQIENSICFVGYTATGLADLVTAPVYRSVPGVMAHANVVNMLLQNQPAVRASRWVGVTILLIFGALLTAFTSRCSPLKSVVSLALCVLALLGAGWMAFRTSGYHIPTLPGVVAMAVSWAGVTAFRQLTEERVRRRFQLALAQYTAPAVAARIANRIGTGDLTPVSERVSCFFSDLQGFTALSERIGPEQTRDRLNPYLESVAGILVENGGLVNKFMGDGIFAFFNAPILRCPTHATAACAAAVAAQRAMVSVNARAADEGPLVMRIGISTGDVFVGDYGSRTKLDYTCIGDTVNMGSRLEQANKAFQTSILIDGATRDEAGDGFVFRSLGLITLPGKRTAVAVSELVGVAGKVAPNASTFAAAFAAVVRRYQACQWSECATQLTACRVMRPDDAACRLYARNLEHIQANPPGRDWDRTLLLDLG